MARRTGGWGTKRAAWDDAVVTSESLGSQRFQRALKSTGAELLAAPIKHGSFYCHAVIARGGQGTVFLATGDDGALSRIRDAGIPVYYFTGNHDMWMFRYLTDEFGIPIYREPMMREIGGKRFYIGHGDGLGPGDVGYAAAILDVLAANGMRFDNPPSDGISRVWVWS